MNLSESKWFKSSRSKDATACVETAFLDMVGVRDSKDRIGPALVFTPTEWDAFAGCVQDGVFDCC